MALIGRLRPIAKKIGRTLKRDGGVANVLRRAARVYGREGPGGVWWRLRLIQLDGAQDTTKDGITYCN